MKCDGLNHGYRPTDRGPVIKNEYELSRPVWERPAFLFPFLSLRTSPSRSYNRVSSRTTIMITWLMFADDVQWEGEYCTAGDVRKLNEIRDVGFVIKMRAHRTTIKVLS